MRNSFVPIVEKAREKGGPFASNVGDLYGRFFFLGPFGGILQVIVSSASEEYAWDHVSVSMPNRCPNWPEMSWIKSLFFDDEETVMQLHPPKSQYVNNHPYCLHLWRPIKENIPLPPLILV